MNQKQEPTDENDRIPTNGESKKFRSDKIQHLHIAAGEK
jgi:hypothetical protein